MIWDATSAPQGDSFRSNPCRITPPFNVPLSVHKPPSIFLFSLSSSRGSGTQLTTNDPPCTVTSSARALCKTSLVCQFQKEKKKKNQTLFCCLSFVPTADSNHTISFSLTLDLTKYTTPRRLSHGGFNHRN